MTKLCWLRGGRSARGAPPLRRAPRRHPVLLPVLTLLILSQTGCLSGFFGPCGPCANGPFRAFRERVFNRGGSCLGGGCPGGATVISDVPVVEGAPAVIAPAPVMTPGATMSAPSEVSPQLDPLPSAVPGPASGSSGESNGTQGARVPAGKVNYEAARPRYRVGRFRSGYTTGASTTLNFSQKTPAPTYRSAQGASAVSRPVAVAQRRPAEPRPAELSLLENLPPLDLPRDDARAEIRTAAAEGEANAATPAPDRSVIEVEATPAPVVPAEVTVAPGLRKFAVVEPKLAGGSLPKPEGLDWLAEKGYKTLVDLREPSEVAPTFIADVSRRGLRYISLPTSLATVDSTHVTRFHFEISLADTRPLYFFDSDGNRAGMLWYIDRMSVKNESYDPEEASRQADEVGLSEPSFRQAAKQYLEGAKVASSPSPRPVQAQAASAPAPAEPDRTPASESASLPGPTPSLPDEATLPEKPERLPVPEAASLNMATVTTTPTTAARPDVAEAWSSLDPNAWRPLLALLLAAMGVPLAYWSRSVMSFRGLKRASLPGPGRRLRSLPAGSGE
jgi:hypothetical protein